MFIPVIIVPRWLAKYLCVFFGSLFAIVGVHVAVQPSSREMNNLSFGLFIFGVGFFNVIIGLLDFPWVRKSIMDLLRPMPFKHCPLCKEDRSLFFADNLRTMAYCMFCHAGWRFYYKWRLGREPKSIMLVNPTTDNQGTELLGIRHPLTFWLQLNN